MQQPTVYMQQPTLYMQQPAVYMQQPTVYMQQPTVYMQQPTVCMQQPTAYIQQPIQSMCASAGLVNNYTWLRLSSKQSRRPVQNVTISELSRMTEHFNSEPVDLKH